MTRAGHLGFVVGVRVVDFSVDVPVDVVACVLAVLPDFFFLAVDFFVPPTEDVDVVD